ncbi:hypothetical protein ACVWYH_005119 [Bradyrhizobium sp. GM24.11]
MPLSERYRHQVALLIETLPFVAAEQDFALKGGTAINLFVRDMPRLSVDIDLTYLPVAGRPGIAGRDRCGHEKSGYRHWQGNSGRQGE